MTAGLDRDLPERLVRKLTRLRLTLAIAESCTGGLLGKLVTDCNGSSAVFIESLVTYQNASKVRNLGVTEETLDRFGAVSFECVNEMASGLRTRNQADIVLAVSGIAGPTGGTHEKPIGTVFMGLATAEKVQTKRFQFSGSRRTIREQAAYAGLQWIWDEQS